MKGKGEDIVANEVENIVFFTIIKERMIFQCINHMKSKGKYTNIVRRINCLKLTRIE